jgi:amidase/aspartyl-tRNA(Asn)/glutamyl-tRNA(Gln) amidotransferase subunit A
MSAAEMAMRIRRRDFSPVEVVDALIARIESRNPSLNAFVFKGFDDARSAAKEAEKALAGGAALGPLHGVPTAIKAIPYCFWANRQPGEMRVWIRES